MVDDCHAHRPPRREGPRHPGADRRRATASTSSPARFGKSLGGGIGGFVAAPPAGHRPSAPAGAALPLLQRLPPPVVAGAIKAHRHRRGRPTTGAPASPTHARRFRARARPTPASTSSPARRRSSRSCSPRPRRAQRHGARRSTSAASTSPASSIPVVPKGKARIRTQMSAALTPGRHRHGRSTPSSTPARRSR